MGMSQDPKDLPRQSYKELYREGEGEAGRERDGKTTLQSGLERH